MADESNVWINWDKSSPARTAKATGFSNTIERPDITIGPFGIVIDIQVPLVSMESPYFGLFFASTTPQVDHCWARRTLTLFA
jgi:hypothetical protein